MDNYCTLPTKIVVNYEYELFVYRHNKKTSTQTNKRKNPTKMKSNVTTIEWYNIYSFVIFPYSINIGPYNSGYQIKIESQTYKKDKLCDIKA